MDYTSCIVIHVWTIPLVLLYTYGLYLLYCYTRMDYTSCIVIHVWTIPLVLLYTYGLYLYCYTRTDYTSCSSHTLYSNNSYIIALIINMLLRMLSKCLMLNDNIGITF